MMRSQHNAWIHTLVAIVVVAAGFYFNVSTREWIILVFCIGWVFVAEMFNTAIEFVVDLSTPDYHELAGRAKDVAAGAVLVSAIGAAIVGVVIFLPYVKELLAD